METFDASSERQESGGTDDMCSVLERVADVDHGRADAAPDNHNAIAHNLHPAADKTPTTSNVYQQTSNNNLTPRIINMSSTSSGDKIEAPSLSSESSSELLFEMGYDSDGFMPELEKFFQDFDEEEIPMGTEPSLTAVPTNAADPTATTAAPTTTTAAPTTANTAPTTADATIGAPSFVLITDNDIQKLKVAELREELKSRKLSRTGNKPDLVARLQQAMKDKTPVFPEGVSEATPASFAAGSFWEILHPGEPIPDPKQRDHRAPTHCGDNHEITTPHRNFEIDFDRPPFISSYERPCLTQFKKREIDSTTKQKKKISDATQTEGMPDIDWLDKHNLNHDSEPYDFFQAFLPDNLIDKWSMYTNTKAMRANAGKKRGGRVYPDYVDFSPSEFKRHLGLYILHGISPSPRIEHKFNNQKKDPVNGNDMVHRLMGPNANRRHKHWRRFMGVQDPIQINRKTKREDPLWKVRDLLNHIQQVSTEAWVCGRDVSADEQTLSFQGKHEDKLRVTFKAAGDGFMCDAICNDGYTYCFYFRNMPPPEKYIRQGMSALHARVLSLFDKLRDKYHRCGMDNLYNSVKFCRDAYKHEKKVLVHGVARKSGRGLPDHVIQDEVQQEKDQARVRNTVKAAVLKGDNECPNLVACSVYDTKPVHFISMCCESIKWIVKTRKIYDKTVGTMTKMNFLCLNINNQYNYGMGDVDLADQLRLVYKVNVWLRNYKWWHTFFWWGVQVLIVNSFVVYKKVLKQAGMTPMSHYEYQKAIALGLLDEETYGSKRAGYNTPTDDASMSTMSSANSSTTASGLNKRKRIADQALDPIDGNLRCRLNSQLSHWPQTARKDKAGNKPRCQLHRWACGHTYSKQTNVVYCAECNVNLCTDGCYEIFHSKWDIVESKMNLRDEFVKSGPN